MNKFSCNCLSILSFTGILVFASVQNANAYIDPGTGSMILQAVIGAVVGSAMAIKIFWRRIKSFCLKLAGRGNSAPTDAED